MPIRIRLALAFGLVTLLLVAIGGLLFARSFRDGLESSLAPGLRTQASSLARLVTGPNPPEGIGPEATDPTLRVPDVVAQVLDPAGRVVAGTGEAGPHAVIGPDLRRRALRGPVFANVRVKKEGEPYRALARPVATHDGTRIIIGATSLEPTNAAVRRVEDALRLGGAAAVLVAAIGGWALARAALRPVERMRRRAAELLEHDSDPDLPVPSTHDEIAALATTMNALLTDLRANLDRQRAFVADAGHELRTPLAVLSAELELAGRPQRTAAELRDAVAHASQETDRLTRLTEQLLFLAQSDKGALALRREPSSVAPVVEGAVTGIAARAAERAVTIELDVDPDANARIDPDLLRRVVDNLLENALRHSPEGGSVDVRVVRFDDEVVIEVGDQGPGFPVAFLPHAFERFRRADDARTLDAGGAGLGLAIVHAIALGHGGRATAENDPGGGARVTIWFPSAGAGARPS